MLVCILVVLGLPGFMVIMLYPFSKKASRYWADIVTDWSASMYFSLLTTFTSYRLYVDRESLRKLPEKFVIVGNHQSLLDIVVTYRVLRKRNVRFVAKDSLAKVPMIGHMLKCQGHCIIPRKGKTSVAMGKLQKFATDVKEQGFIPLIFPEGTRSKDGSLGTFYAAGFRKIEENVRLPVAVIAYDGGWQARTLPQILRNLTRGFYKFKVLEVLSAPMNKEEEVHALDKAKDLIQKQLDEWRK